MLALSHIFGDKFPQVVTQVTTILENVLFPTLQIDQPPLMFFETLLNKSQFLRLYFEKNDHVRIYILMAFVYSRIPL